MSVGLGISLPPVWGQEAGVAEVEEVSEDLADGAADGTDAHAGDQHDATTHAPGDHEPEAHGEVHIPHDVTAANLSPETWEVVDFRTDIALFTGVVFLLLLAGLYMAAWKPITLGLEKREWRIADNIARAEKAAAEAEARLAEYDAKLAAANQEVQTLLAEARRDAEAVSQRMISEAQQEAERLRQRAVAEIDSAKRQALSELAAKSSDLAFSLARRVVQHEIKPEDHQALIQDLLAKLPSNN